MAGIVSISVEEQIYYGRAWTAHFRRIITKSLVAGLHGRSFAWRKRTPFVLPRKIKPIKTRIVGMPYFVDTWICRS